MTYLQDEPSRSTGHDRASTFSVAIKFVLAECHLTGGGGFIRIEDRPKVLERQAEFLPATVIHSTTEYIKVRMSVAEQPVNSK